MADNAVPTLAPEKHASQVLESPPAPSPTAPLKSDKDALFDSIAHEGIDGEQPSQSSSMRTFFAGLLWFGYAVAIVVALALVWSAAKGLFQPLPR